MDNIMEIVAQLMELSARTAPKAGGKDYVVSKIIRGDDLRILAEAMEAYGKETDKKNFDRDGSNVLHSDAVLLLGLKDAKNVGLNCGACGFNDCASLVQSGLKEGPEFAGPICAWRLMDLGLALGSAVKTASILNADNRIMYRIGVVARRLGMLDGQVIVGIPISMSGKNIYFDR